MSKYKLLTTFDKLVTSLFILVICFLLLLSVNTYGQNVGINNPSPAASALLDLTSTNKGLLVPRMTTAERTAILSPAEALLVYDLDLDEFLFYNGTAWKNLYTEKSGWSVNGNNGISSSNFIGTINNAPLRMRVNNVPSGYVDFGTTILGYNTDPSANELSCVIGAYAGAHAPNFSARNVFVGYLSGGATTFCHDNTFIGAYSGWKNTTGSENVFVGTNAGNSNTIGFENVYIGFYAGYNGIGSNHNVYVGDGSGYSATSSSNTFVGSASGNFVTTGGENTLIGRSAGYDLTTGAGNTFIGSMAKGTPLTMHSVAIGHNALVTSNYSMVLGGTGPDAVKVGIGVTAPSAELEVNGYTMLGSAAPKIQMLKITGTTPANQGTTVNIAHGLTLSKIISVTVLVEASAATVVPPSYTALTGYEFTYRLNSSNIVLTNMTGNSANILSKPVRVLVTYEQ